MGFNAIYGIGNYSSIDLKWVVRGKEASIYPIVSVSESIGGGFSIDATINFGGLNYAGNVNEIKRSMVQTSTPSGDIPTIWGSVGITAGGKIGVTGGVTPLGNGRFLLQRQLNIGGGIPAGPVPINAAGGISNTWIIKDWRK